MIRSLRSILVAGVVLATVVCLAGAAVPENAAKPFAVALADDDHTRGDWIGTYGTYAYLLCAMRAPHFLCGGTGWPVEMSFATGDPAERIRSWRSTAAAEGDRSVLLEPSGLRRTPAALDDHGEVRPPGKGPDLHIGISIPEGAFLLSLYFFEIDWIQYRAYRIQLVADGKEPRILAETTASDFFKGKYKRFVVMGPVKLRVVIERGQSPNAQISGIFLDEMKFPDMGLLDKRAENRAEVNGKLLAGAAGRDPVELTFAPLYTIVGNPTSEQEYIQKEKLFFSLARRLERTAPERYYRRLGKIWDLAEKRIVSASAGFAKSSVALETLLLRYYAARAHHNYENARQATRQIADYLLKQAMVDAQNLEPPGALRLRDYASDLLQRGRRAEAYPLLDAYARFCVARETPATAKQHLLSMGRLALRTGVPMPIARGLSRYKESRGPLARDERLLLGNLYYVAGRNEKAFNEFKTVEPDMPFGQQHKWLLIAMLTSLLRTDRVEEAKAVMEKLRADYPEGAEAEVDEARFRFGEYYFRGRDLKQARSSFENLVKTSGSEAYTKMCAEYLKRIAHLEDIRTRKDK